MYGNNYVVFSDYCDAMVVEQGNRYEYTSRLYSRERNKERHRLLYYLPYIQYTIPYTLYTSYNTTDMMLLLYPALLPPGRLLYCSAILSHRVVATIPYRMLPYTVCSLTDARGNQSIVFYLIPDTEWMNEWSRLLFIYINYLVDARYATLTANRQWMKECRQRIERR